jgi:WD40 repeat protein/serine/threonine protein kinase
MAPKSIDRIFWDAAQLASAADRAGYLDGACNGDAGLRKRVEQLLQARAKADSFLELPATAPADTADEAADERPGAAVGPYRLVERLGEGGMGTVWLAQQQEPVRRLVALKVIKAGMDTAQVVARFEAERQALALMDHPNIARVLDAGTTQEGRPFFVMELVRGVPITAYCDEQRLTLRARLGLFVAVCAALQHAHQKGVIHRDIKPSNVLVALYDGRPVVKVIDFGVAKAAGQPLTERTLVTGLGALVGTLEYMSPEQAHLNSQDVDTRSDVYSLGVLLYELLTGTTPLGHGRVKEAGLVEALRAIREEEAPRPSALLSTAEELPTIAARRGVGPGALSGLLRGELDWIVLKALDKDRNRRYESANGLAADVQRYLDDEPVQACPPTLGYRLRKFARRHRAAAALVTTVVFALLLSTGVSSLFALRAHTAAREADRQAAEARAAADRENREKELAWLHLYVARAQTAQQAWRDGNVARARELLIQMRPGSGQPDLRGLEWYYLWRLIHAEPATFRGPASGARGVAFSSDGQLLAAVGADRWDEEARDNLTGEVKVWDVGSGRALRSFPEEPGYGSAVAFSAAGRLLARRRRGGAVEIWGLTADRPVTTLPPAGNVYSLAFSPNGKRLAVGYGSGAGAAPVKLWEVGSGRLSLTLPGHAHYVSSLAFSPDGRLLASGGHDSSLRVWDLVTGREALALKNRTGSVNGVAFSPDGTHVAGAGDRTATVWNVKTGEEAQSLWGHAGTVTSVAFSPDGSRLASGGVDRTVRVWDLKTGRESQSLKGHTESVWSVAFSPDGSRLASGSFDGTVKVWGATTNPEVRAWEGGLGLAFSPDGRRLAFGGRDKTILIRDTANGRELLRLNGVGATMSFSPDGKRLATAGGPYGFDRTVYVWDATTGERALSLNEKGLCADVVAFSPDNRLLAASGHEGLRVWDTKTGRPVPALRRPPGTARHVAFSVAGDRLAASAGRQVTLWDTGTGRAVQSLAARNGEVGVLAFSPNGRRLAAAVNERGRDGVVIVWDLETGREAFVLQGQTGLITCIAFSPDSQRLAGGTGGLGANVNKSTLVKVWELRTGQVVLGLEAGYRDLRALAFSPDGDRLACVGDSLRVWDAAPRGDSVLAESPPAR